MDQLFGDCSPGKMGIRLPDVFQGSANVAFKTRYQLRFEEKWAVICYCIVILPGFEVNSFHYIP